MQGELYILALLRGNITFRLTSVKPFHVGDIEVSSEGPEDNPEYYNKNKGKGDSSAGIIPLAIPAIPLKRGRGRPRKNPNIMVFL